jgi:hypothetical protein
MGCPDNWMGLERIRDRNLTGSPSGVSLASRIMEHFIGDIPALNVHQLHRAGALVLGTETRWQWGTFVATFRAEASGIVISAAGRETTVELHYEPGTLGNDYPVFECPGCGVRRWTLYLTDVVGCRGCLQIRYRSQHENDPNPALSRVAKIRRRLGAELGLFAPIPPRPGWQTGRAVWTYDRLVAQLHEAEAQAVLELNRMVSKLARRLD